MLNFNFITFSDLEWSSWSDCQSNVDSKNGRGCAKKGIQHRSARCADGPQMSECFAAFGGTCLRFVSFDSAVTNDGKSTFMV